MQPQPLTLLQPFTSRHACVGDLSALCPLVVVYLHTLALLSRLCCGHMAQADSPVYGGRSSRTDRVPGCARARWCSPGSVESLHTPACVHWAHPATFRFPVRRRSLSSVDAHHGAWSMDPTALLEFLLGVARTCAGRYCRGPTRTPQFSVFSCCTYMCVCVSAARARRPETRDTRRKRTGMCACRNCQLAGLAHVDVCTQTHTYGCMQFCICDISLWGIWGLYMRDLPRSRLHARDQ